MLRPILPPSWGATRLLLVIVSMLCACRSGSRSSPPAPVASASAEEPASDGAPSDTCPTIVTDTRSGGLTPGSYETPSEAERRSARAAFAALLRGETPDVRTFGFEVVPVPDWPGVSLLREVPERKRGGGAYLFRAGSASTLVVQAPHTFYDEGTLPLACDMFQRTGARALFLNTTHRYKSAPETKGGEHPADVAHAPDTFFLSMTEGLIDAIHSVDVIQLHGFQNREAAARAVISSGERRSPPPLVQKARAALEAVVGPRVMVYPDDTNELGATTNVEGMAVRRAGGRFLHVEMDGELRRSLRTNGGLRRRALDALAASFR